MRRGSPCAVAPTSWKSSVKGREGEREGGNPPCPPTNVLYPCPSRCDELWNSNESCPMPTDPPRANIWRKKTCESLASCVKHVSFETQRGHQFFRPRPALVPDLENLANISSPRVCGEDHIKDDVDGRIKCLSPPFSPQHGRNGVQTNSGSPQSFEVHTAY